MKEGKMIQEFLLLGDPRPQGRPRFYKRGNFIGVYDPKESKEYKQTIAAQIAAQNPVYISDKAVSLEVELADFIKACNDDELIEAWSFKVSYPALRRVLDKHMSERLEKEAKERKERERRELEERLQYEKEQTPQFVKELLMKIKTL